MNLVFRLSWRLWIADTSAVCCAPPQLPPPWAGAKRGQLFEALHVISLTKSLRYYNPHITDQSLKLN